MQAIAAIYVRLSKDDLNTDCSKSIENQIKGLTEYCNENKIKIFEIFSDDGYSGGSFDRPAFKDMIKKMEQNKFNTIVVKDLSRLGRSFVHVGEYIENVFPNNNIRFISVSDNYDSLTYKDDESIVIRSFLNDYYLKECKKKAQAAVRKRSSSKPMSTGGIYGYKYDENKNLIIDDRAALIVQEIFERYSNKEKPINICNDLTNRKIPTLAYQSIINYGKNRFRIKEENKYKWELHMLRRVLTNIEYTGVAVNREKIFKNGKWYKNENPILIEDSIPQIITKELFDKAQAVRNNKNFKKSDDLNSLRLKGVIYCKKCNKPMRYIREVNKYECSSCRLRVKANDIHEAALLDSKAIIKEYNLNRKAFQKRTIQKLLDEHDIKTYKELSKRKSEIDNLIGKLFEEKLEGKISSLQYKEKIDILKEENNLIEKQLFEFENLGVTEKLLTDNFIKFTKSIEQIDINDSMNLLNHMIKRIYISNEHSLKIVYRFSEV